MRKIYIPFILIAFLMFSCKEDKIMLYKSADFLQFNKAATDSSICSFLPYPDKGKIEFPLAIDLIGNLTQTDRKYRLEVVTDRTNAPKENYEIPAECVFRAGMYKDTCWITLKKTPGISQKPVKLVLKLVESPDFKVGQTERSMAVIYVSNVISKPDWWNSEVTYYYLGDYSDKKYHLFVQVTGKITINIKNSEELRLNTLKLKYYLLKEKEAGRTVYEEDGTEMKVSLITG